MKKCGRRRKTKYPSQDDAQVALLEMWTNTRESIDGIHVYPCPEWGYWHVGHKAKISFTVAEMWIGKLANAIKNNTH